MLIHSVTPAWMLTPNSEQPMPEIRQVNGAFLEGTVTPQGFALSRLVSTDPTLYLRKDYQPGSRIRLPDTNDSDG